MKQMLPHINFIFKRNIRDKKNIYYIMMMSLCSIIFIIVLCMAYLYYINLNTQFNKNTSFRTLIVLPSKAEMMKYILNNDTNDYAYNFDEIKSIEHITDVYSSKESMIAINDVKIGPYQGETLYLLYGTESSIPNLIAGHGIKYDDENVAICSNKIIPKESITYKEIEKKEILDGNSLLNSNISGKYDLRKYDKEKEKNIIIGEKKVEFKIVGVYDIKNSYFEMNQCFISGKQLEKMINDYLPKKDFSSVTSLFVHIDSRKNVDNVKRELERLGYSVNYKSYVSSSYLIKLISILSVVSIISLIGIFIISLLYIKKKILNNSHFISMLSSVGYQKNNIKAYYLIDNFSIIFISSLSVILFALVTDTIISLSMKEKLINIGVVYFMPYLIIIIGLLIIGITSSLTNICYVEKQLKNSLIRYEGD